MGGPSSFLHALNIVSLQMTTHSPRDQRIHSSQPIRLVQAESIMKQNYAVTKHLPEMSPLAQNPTRLGTIRVSCTAVSFFPFACPFLYSYSLTAGFEELTLSDVIRFVSESLQHMFSSLSPAVSRFITKVSWVVLVPPYQQLTWHWLTIRLRNDDL